MISSSEGRPCCLLHVLRSARDEGDNVFGHRQKIPFISFGFNITLTQSHHHRHQQECPECSGPIVGRNYLVENIAAVVFSRELSMSNRYHDDDKGDDNDDDGGGHGKAFLLYLVSS